MQESIYNIIEPEVRRPMRAPRYTSTHKNANGKTALPTGSTFNCAGTANPGVTNLGGNGDYRNPTGYDKNSGTMGAPPRPRSQIANPAGFLKSGKHQVASLSEMQRTNPGALQPTTLKTKTKPALPGPKDQPLMGLASSKNFIVANAVENILAAPKRAMDNEIDFLAKEDFGQTPQYLNKIKSDINAEYEYIRQLREEEEAANAQTRPLSNPEKEALIQGLKAKWEQVNSEYQLTTHLTKFDTVGKIQRKGRQEKELTEIESKIDKLKRDNIFVDVTA